MLLCSKSIIRLETWKATSTFQNKRVKTDKLYIYQFEILLLNDDHQAIILSAYKPLQITSLPTQVSLSYLPNIFCIYYVV